MWEYRVVTSKLDVDLLGRPSDESDRFTQGLNELGAQDWELVSALDTNYVQGGSAQILFLFKRPLQQ